TNDVPVISGDIAGSVTEDVAVDSSGNLTTGGKLTITDADHDQSSFTPQTTSGSYGSFTVAADGAWAHTDHDRLVATGQLNPRQLITDSFTAVAIDGTAGQVVTVTIHGTTDAFVIGPLDVIDLKFQPNNTLPYPLVENNGTITSGSDNPNSVLGDITGTGLI